MLLNKQKSDQLAFPLTSKLLQHQKDIKTAQSAIARIFQIQIKNGSSGRDSRIQGK